MKTMPRVSTVLVILLAAVLGAAADGASNPAPKSAPKSAPPPAPKPTPTVANPIAVPSGRVVLPITGLELVLPKVAGHEYHLSGSWNLDLEKVSFDARDVLDEFRGEDIVAGNWLHIGYFNAGTCDKVVAEADVTESWSGETVIDGARFALRGGVWDFENSLGKAPMVAACYEVGEGQAQLLLYRFLVGQPVTMPKDAVIAEFKSAAVPTLALQAFRTNSFSDAQPTHHAELRNRGTIAPTYTRTFPLSGLTVTMPDDGYIWLPRTSAASDNSEYLDRMAPSLPDASIEFMIVDGMNCADALALFADSPVSPDSPSPTGVPSGWVGGSQMALDTGRVETILCQRVTRGALIAGILQTPHLTDIHNFAPVLEALARSAR